MNRTLWVIQWLLACLFLFAGGYKLVVPIEEMLAQMPPMPAWFGTFLQVIGVCEVLGGLGLVLPGLLHIKPGLTPLAAAGLVVIMIGAVVVTVAGGMGAMAIMPFVVGSLAAFVAYGRWSRA